MESLDSDMPRENNSFGNEQIRRYLSETARWGMFLAIVGYIGVGLMVLAAIFIMAAGSSIDLAPGVGVPMCMLGLVYVRLCALFFFPIYYLHQFSMKTKRGLALHDLQDMTVGFQNLKSLFKFMGIYTIVILSI